MMTTIPTKDEKHQQRMKEGTKVYAVETKYDGSNPDPSTKC